MNDFSEELCYQNAVSEVGFCNLLYKYILLRVCEGKMDKNMLFLNFLNLKQIL
jgi:hypothetical protein